MILDAACAHFGVESGWHMSTLLPANQQIDCDLSRPGRESWTRLFQQHCNIWRDHATFVGGAALADDDLAAHFGGLRRVYPDRLEYPRFTVNRLDGCPAATRIRVIGLKVFDRAQGRSCTTLAEESVSFPGFLIIDSSASASTGLLSR